ncbi:MAG: CRISPR-associated protein Cas4, partial [Candidatus Eremiobacteraeota bacterium]|nr:CRISPR-associated protein Cas4 [Candidatus Eremiobacteraeota bacterium]
MSENPGTALVPARIVNEHVYCPRLAWLEWEARAFTDNLDTAEGTDDHRRVDQEHGKLDEDGGDAQATSLMLSSERLGVVARIDRVERRAGETVPVETKHGRPRRGSAPVWPPELAQIAVQALLLREYGHTVPHAEVYFPETRGRHRVEISPDAEQWVTRLVAEIRTNAAQPMPPAPLIDSPKCPRCSLVGICLPDETNLLAKRAAGTPRRLVARDDSRRPLYVISPAAIVRKRAGRLILEVDGEHQTSVRVLDVAHVAVFGNATVSAGAMRACLEGDIPVLWFSSGGWLAGYSIAHGGSWVARRIAQVERARGEGSVVVARVFVAGKIRNQRTLLRRLGGEWRGCGRRSARRPNHAQRGRDHAWRAARRREDRGSRVLRRVAGVAQEFGRRADVRRPQSPSADGSGQRDAVVCLLAAGAGHDGG